MDGGNLENSAATQPDASVPTPETAVRAGASAPQPAVPEKSKSEQALELAEALRKIPEVIIPPLSAGAMNVSPASAFAVFSQVSATSGFALESSPITVAFNAPTFVSNVEIDGTDTIPAKVSVRYMNQSGQWKEATPIFRNAYGGYFSSVGSLASRIEIYRSSRSKTVRLAKVRVLGFSGFGTPAWGESYRAFVRLVDECRTSISEDYDKLVSERNEVEARKSELATVQAQWSQDIAGLKAERTKLAGCRISAE